MGYSPKGAIAVFADDESAIVGDRHSHGAPPNGVVVHHESGEKVFINPGRNAMIETHPHDLIPGS